MPLLSVPSGIEDLTVDWVDAALSDISDGAHITGLEVRRIGMGNVADSVRLVPVWDRPTAAPGSLVAKVPSSSPESRAAGFSTRTYELEAAFYNELASTVWVNAPRCYLARFDAAAEAYVVLLEDLAPAEPGDQVAGCRLEEAAAATAELAALHAPRWEDPDLIGLAWLDRPSPEGAEAAGAFVATVFEGFSDRYRARVEPPVMAVAERLMSSLGRYLAGRPRPWSLVHGDYRADNLFFGGPRVAVVDWQTVKIGPPLSDVSYFIGSALAPAARREAEKALVRAYHEALLQAGVDVVWSECWDGYRRYAFDGLVMAVAASMLVSRTPRSDDMFMAMVNRHGRQAIDLGSWEFVG